MLVAQKYFPQESVIDRMRQVINTNYIEMDSILNYIMKEPGKMLRPRLVFLSASVYSEPVENVRDIAVAIELIHLASLVHDDIIDQAILRRGQDSVNQRWGEKASVLCGDFLFATAFNLISNLGHSEIMRELTQTIRIMCLGEINQMKFASQRGELLDDYWEKTFQKTACLFASACKSGALASAMPGVEMEKIEEYGLYLGYAYQVIDDVLDWIADSERFGKPVGSDLLSGNITLPVIIALQSHDKGAAVLEVIDDHAKLNISMNKIMQLITESQAIERSLEICRTLINEARKSLRSFQNIDVIIELEKILDYVLMDYIRANSNYYNNQYDHAIQ